MVEQYTPTYSKGHAEIETRRQDRVIKKVNAENERKAEQYASQEYERLKTESEQRQIRSLSPQEAYKYGMPNAGYIDIDRKRYYYADTGQRFSGNIDGKNYSNTIIYKVSGSDKKFIGKPGVDYTESSRGKDYKLVGTFLINGQVSHYVERFNSEGYRKLRLTPLKSNHSIEDNYMFNYQAWQPKAEKPFVSTKDYPDQPNLKPEYYARYPNLIPKDNITKLEQMEIEEQKKAENKYNIEVEEYKTKIRDTIGYIPRKIENDPQAIYKWANQKISNQQAYIKSQKQLSDKQLKAFIEKEGKELTFYSTSTGLEIEPAPLKNQSISELATQFKEEKLTPLKFGTETVTETGKLIIDTGEAYIQGAGKTINIISGKEGVGSTPLDFIPGYKKTTEKVSNWFKVEDRNKPYKDTDVQTFGTISGFVLLESAFPVVGTKVYQGLTAYSLVKAYDNPTPKNIAEPLAMISAPLIFKGIQKYGKPFIKELPKTTKSMFADKTGSLRLKSKIKYGIKRPRATVKKGKPAKTIKIKSKTQIRKESLQQYKDPRKFLDIQTREAGVKIRSKELKNTYVKERVVRRNIQGEIRITDKGLRTDVPALKGDAITIKGNKAYPKGYGSQSIPKNKPNFDYIIKQQGKSGMEMAFIQQGKLKGGIKLTKRQPTYKFTKDQSLISINRKIEKGVMPEVEILKPKYTTTKTAVRNQKGFRVGMKEKLVTRLEPKIKESRLRIENLRSIQDYALVEKPTFGVSPFENIKSLSGRPKKVKINIFEEYIYNGKMPPSSNLGLNQNFKVGFDNIYTIKPGDVTHISTIYDTKLNIWQQRIIPPVIIIKDKTEQTQINDTKKEIREDIKEIFKVKPIQKTNVKIEEIQKPETINKTFLSSSSKTGTATDQILQPKEKESFVPDINIVPGPITPTFKVPNFELPKIEEPEKPKFPFTIEPKTEKKFDGKGFNTYVKERRKFVRVNEKPLNYISALALGSHVVDNTTSRSFKVKETNQKPQKGSYNLFNKQKYYRKKSGVWVEKSKHAIDTIGEMQGITVKGWKARRKGVRKGKTNNILTGLKKMF